MQGLRSINDKTTVTKTKPVLEICNEIMKKNFKFLLNVSFIVTVLNWICIKNLTYSNKFNSNFETKKEKIVNK